MSKSDAWMPFYIADYLRKTMHLTRDQHGGYLLLLMACWDSGGRLPNDPAFLAATVKASPGEWRKLSPVLLRYFDLDGEHITQKRVLKEYGKAARLSEIRREIGARGGRKPKPIATANAKPNDEQTETPADVARHSPAELDGPSEPSNISKRKRAASLAKGEPASCAWVGPSDVRSAFSSLGEDWCRSYLDPCGWQDVPERAIIPANGYAASKIIREARAILAKNNLIVLERAA